MNIAAEEAIAWARSLPPDEHKCDWEEVVRGTHRDHYRPVDDVCRICGKVKPTAIVQVMR